MWRDGEGKPAWPGQPFTGPIPGPIDAIRLRNGRRGDGNPLLANPLAAAMPDSSGLLRDDRCAIERRHDRIRRGQVPLAVPLEQHPPFESAGSHVGEALEY